MGIQTIEKGDIVRCIDDGFNTSLTVGKHYDVQHNLWGNWVQIINDNGEEETYDLNLFEFSNCLDQEDDLDNAWECQDLWSEYGYEESEEDVKDDVEELPEGIKGKTDLQNKPHLAYFDPYLEYEMGIGMRKGAIKHGWNNHREMTDEAAQHVLDSLKRHLNAYLRGEELDPELQINHLACVVNNANFLYRIASDYGYEAVMRSIYGE